MNQELISVRKQLTEGGTQTPLRKFYGVLKEYYPDEQFGKTRVIFNSIDVEVLEVAEGEVYNFPTATISIPLSNAKNSGWGIFQESLAALLPDDQDLKDCIGKRLGWEMEVGHTYREADEKKSQEAFIGNPWRVFEVEGVVAGAASTTAMDVAKGLLDGKTRAQFNKAAYADPIIRKDTEFQRAITDKSFITAVVQQGEFTEDEDGVFHRVAKE